jgi:hypothetical protein
VATSRRLIAISLAFGAIACAADPTLLNLVMPDAKVAFGVNVEKIVASPISQQLGAQIRQAPPELQQIFKGTGFDPTRDLKEILIASTGQGQNAPTLILARGTFDIAKLSAFAVSSGRPAVLYEGVPILTHPSQSSGAMALLDSTTVIGGDLDQVQAAIRRRANSAPLGTEFAAKAARLSEQYDVWGFSTVSLASMVPAAAPNPSLQQAADLLKAIRQVSGGMRFSPDMEMAVEVVTRTQKDAENIRDTLGFVSAFLTANQKNPSGLKADALKVSVNARTVHIALHITEAELKKAYQMQMARNAAMPGVTTNGGQPPAQPKARPADTGLIIQSSEKDMGTVTLPPATKN